MGVNDSFVIPTQNLVQDSHVVWGGHRHRVRNPPDATKHSQSICGVRAHKFCLFLVMKTVLPCARSFHTEKDLKDISFYFRFMHKLSRPFQQSLALRQNILYAPWFEAHTTSTSMCGYLPPNNIIIVI